VDRRVTVVEVIHLYPLPQSTLPYPPGDHSLKVARIGSRRELRDVRKFSFAKSGRDWNSLPRSWLR
jgi:hypothetical protein